MSLKSALNNKNFEQILHWLQDVMPAKHVHGDDQTHCLANVAHNTSLVRFLETVGCGLPTYAQSVERGTSSPNKGWNSRALAAETCCSSRAPVSDLKLKCKSPCGALMTAEQDPYLT